MAARAVVIAAVRARRTRPVPRLMKNSVSEPSSSRDSGRKVIIVRGGDQIRRPKVEGRKKAETRDPNRVRGPCAILTAETRRTQRKAERHDRHFYFENST